MPTSPHDGVILYDPNALDTDQPIDTVLVRDAVIGSALHRADVAGQARAAWAAVDPALTNDAPYIDLRDAHPTSGGVLQVATVTYARWYAFPLRARFLPKVRTFGDGYRLRIRVGGASSDGDRVDFAIVLAPHAAHADLYEGTGGTVIAAASNITSTTAAWLTFDSGDDFVDVTEETIARALDLAGVELTQTDVGGDDTSLRVPPVEVIVVGQRWDLGSVPHLYGVATAETYGA